VESLQDRQKLAQRKFTLPGLKVHRLPIGRRDVGAWDGVGDGSDDPSSLAKRGGADEPPARTATVYTECGDLARYHPAPIDKLTAKCVQQVVVGGQDQLED